MKLSDLKSSNYLFVIALILLSVISVNQWLKVEIGNTAISYAIYIYFFGTIVYFICQHKIKIFEPQYLSVVSFLIIAALGVVKGYFVAENYWEYKNLFFNACILMKPLLVYVLGSPDMLKQSVRWWFYIGLLGFATIFYWQVNF